MALDEVIRGISVPAPLSTLLTGTEDARLRATWRVLLTWVLLFAWSVIAALAARHTKPLWDGLPGAAQQILNISVGTAVFLFLFALFARHIDRRPLSDYGFTRSRLWGAELAIGFLALLGATALWHGLGVVMGWTTVEVAIDPADVTAVLWLVALLVPWYFSGLTQALFSVALVTRNAAEGLAAREATLAQAATGAVIVAVLFFTLRHSPSGLPRVLSLVVGGGVFTLLYVHSGNLALTIGAIGSANYTANFVFTSTATGVPAAERLQVFRIAKSYPEAVEVLTQANLPVMVLTYLLAVGWLVWQRDGVTIHPSITEWTPLTDRSRD